MRYQSIKAFLNHLLNARPNHFCRVYLIAISDDYERKKIVDSCLSFLTSHTTMRSFNFPSLLSALQSPSLFGGEPVSWMDEAEKLSKQEVQEFSQFLQSPIEGGYIVVGARGKTPLMGPIEKQGIVLDLLEEKPWEREKRLSEEIAERVENAGKKISLDVRTLLLEKISDPAQLNQEIDKLLCYVAERPSIEKSDVLQIVSGAKTQTVWQTVDEIVWEKGECAVSSELFSSLLPLIRSQLQLGLKLASLIENKVPSEEWSAYLPKMWPKTLEKRKNQAKERGSRWFSRGLECLFEIELLSRDGSSQTTALLDLFRLKLYHSSEISGSP